MMSNGIKIFGIPYYLYLVVAVLAFNLFMFPVTAYGTSPSGATSSTIAGTDSQYWLYPQTTTFSVDYSGASYIIVDNDRVYAGPYAWEGSSSYYPGTSSFNKTLTSNTNCMRVFFVGPNTYRYFKVTTSAPNQYLTASYTVSPTSGTAYAPALVNFTDTSSGSPTGWSWNFGDGSELVTTQNPSHTFSSGGVYNVSLTVTKSGSDPSSVTNQYTVNTWVLPSCSYGVSVNQGSSPLQVTFTDTSSNDPQSVIWNFNPLGMGWLTVTPNSYNTSSVATVTFSGTGTLPVYHSATNPAGTDVCPYTYINLSGLAPTPTPTPNIPFPNQTDVCQGSSITLGSGTTSEVYRTAYLTPPSGSSFLFSIAIGDQAYFSSEDYTSQIGTYIYNQYTQPDGVLEWRQSYIVKNCQIPTGTPTGVQTTVQPTYTVYPTNPYPTVTYTINPTSTMPTLTWANASYVPPSLPALPQFANSSNWRDSICNSSYIGSTVCPFVDSYTYIVTLLNDLLLLVISIPLAPITFFIMVWNYVFSLNQSILQGWVALGSVFISVIGQIIGVLPDKVKGVITLIMTYDILKQLYDAWEWV